jgi:hypothetical protein
VIACGEKRTDGASGEARIRGKGEGKEHERKLE